MHVHLHFDDRLQGLGLRWFWSCFVSPVKLLRDTDTTAINRWQRWRIEWGMRGRKSWARSKGNGHWRKRMEGGLNGGCRSRSGSWEGRRALEGRMDWGCNDRRGIVGRTGGKGGGRTDGVAKGRRGRCREGGRGTQWVTAWGREVRRGLEGRRHMERSRNRDGGRRRKRGRDWDWGGGRDKLLPSCSGAGF